jgi:hypothetical protein
MVANNHNLFPLPYWAPALWRVPMPLQVVNEAYARGRGCESERVAQNRWINFFALFEWLAAPPRTNAPAASLRFEVRQQVIRESGQ